MSKENSNWMVQEQGLYRRFIFENFREAFSFMTQVALLAEKYNHHPDWSNSFKTVDIRYYTHDQDAITELDWQMSVRIDRCYASFCSS